MPKSAKYGSAGLVNHIHTGGWKIHTGAIRKLKQPGTGQNQPEQLLPTVEPMSDNDRNELLILQSNRGQSDASEEELSDQPTNSNTHAEGNNMYDWYTSNLIRRRRFHP